MTWGERRLAIRALREATRAVEVAQRVHRDATLRLRPDVFERVEWALGHVKARNPQTGKPMRTNLRVVSPQIQARHLILRGVPVFCGG